VSLPEVCELTVIALDVAHSVIDGLEVDPVAMAANLSAGGQDLQSEQILAALSTLRGKHAAQALMADVVSSGSAGGQGLVAAVATRAGLEAAQVAAWVTRPATGAAPAMADVVLDRAPAARAGETRS
jgi:hypothetical protein